MAEDIDIEDDGFGSFDDFDAPDFDGDVGGGNENRTPVTAAASSFTEAATNNLLSVNAAQRVLRKGLPKGYGEAADLVDEVAGEASDLYDKAEKRLEPAIKSAKEATRGLLPKAEGILPKSVYAKISSWSEDSSRSGGTNADEESISTALGSIFTTQMEQSEQSNQEQTVKDTLKNEVDGQRHEKSYNQMALVQQSVSRLVGYQDTITAAYQKKSLDLQFRHYFAARDLLKLQTAGNADVITALNDIKTNTGLPDWVKTQNSENFQSMLQERLMGGTVESVSDYMGDFRSKLVDGVKTKVLDTVGEVSDGISEITGGITQLTEAQSMMSDMDDGPKEDGKTAAAGFAGDMAGGTVANKIISLLGGALNKKGSKRKAVVEAGLKASNFVRGADGNIKEFIDTAGDRNDLLGTIGTMLQDVMPAMNTAPSVLQNLAEQGTSHVEWDLLSRRTLIEVIPEYLARITQNTESMTTGKPAEKMVYSKTSESFVSEADAVAEATDLFVKRDEINDYRDKSDKVLDKLFGSAEVSEEARRVMSEQIHTDISRGWNLDPRRYVEDGSFESRHDVSAVGELKEFFRDKYKAKDVGTGGQQDWELNLSEQNLNQMLGLLESGKGLQASLPNMQDSINRVVASGDKDLLRSTGWIDNTSGRDQFNSERLTNLMTGRLALDDVQSGWDNAQLKEESGNDATKWRNGNSVEWQTSQAPEAVMSYTYNDTIPTSRKVEETRPVNTLSSSEESVLTSLTKVMSQTSDDSAAMLTRLDTVISGGTEAYTVNNHQLDVLKEIREILITQQAQGISSEDAKMGAELLKRFNAVSADGTGPGLMSQLSDKVLGLGKAGAGALGSYYSTLGGLAGKGANFVTEKASSLMGFVSKKKEDADIFVSGLKTPALRGDFIKSGRYIDVATGKVITKLKDITGEVKDLSTGNIVISIEDFKNGIFNGSGESIINRLGGAARGLVSGAANMLGGYYGFLWDTGKKVLGGIKERALGLNRKLKVQSDVYVKSRMGDGPILLRTKLLRGAYFNMEGNPIFSVGDIDGPVYDEDQNMLLTDEDISDGLVNPQGEDIDVSGLLGGGLGLIGSGIGLAKTAGSKVLGALKGYYAGIGKAGSSLLDKLKNGFGGITVGSEDIDNITITANNVYLNGNIIQQSAAEEAGTSMPTTAKETVTDIGIKVKGKAEETVNNVVTKAKDFRDNKLDTVVDRTKATVKRTAENTIEKAEGGFDKVRDKAEAKYGQKYKDTKEKVTGSFTNLKDKVTDKVKSVKNKLLGQELGEDSVLIGDTKGNVSIKNSQEEIPVGDGSTNGYLAALLAYFHGKNNIDSDDTDGDGLRDGGWRSKLFGKKKEEDTETDGKKKEGNRKTGKGVLASLAGMIGLGGGDSDGEDDDGLASDIASEVAGEVIGDKISGRGKDKGDSSDGDRRKGKGPKAKGKLGRAWQAIKGAGTKVKEFAGGLKGKSLIGGTAAGITATGGVIKGLGGSVATKMAATSGLKKAALWGLKGALGLVGGILGAPIVGTALAIAGAAYTAYEVFGYFSDRAGVEPLEEYRYRQYGLDVEDRSHRSFLRKLEDDAIDYINYRGQDGTENTLDITDIEWHEDIMELLNIDPSVPAKEDPVNAERFTAYLNWFRNRFRPVFLLHHGVAKRLDGDVDLLDIDDEMDDSMKCDFVKLAYYPNDGSGLSPYMVSDSPMEDHTATVGYEEIDALKEALTAEYKVDKADTKKSGDSFLSKMAKGAALLTPVGAAIAASKAFTSESSDGKPKSLTDKVTSAAIAVVPGAAIVKDMVGDKPAESTEINSLKKSSSVVIPETELAAKAGTEAKAQPPTSNATVVKRTLETGKTSGKSGFVVPSEGRISSPHGNRVHPITGDSKFHTGIDIAAPTGTDVFASQGGTITRRGYSRSYGNVVYIDNDDGTHSRYAHLHRFEPGYRVGDRIEQGNKVAEIGSTGWSTGPHLHFEVRKKASDKNSSLDPLALFKGDTGREARVQVKNAITAAKVEKNLDDDEVILEGEETILSTMKGPTEVTHDQKRAKQASKANPLVLPSLMVPTKTETFTPKYTKDTVATADTNQDVVVNPSINVAPTTPIRKMPVEDAPIVEVEVLQQKRALISQEDANVRGQEQLDAIGLVLTEQLRTQQRMEVLLTDVVNNTKATADGIAEIPQPEALPEKKKSTQSTRNQPAVNGNQLAAMMKTGEAKSVSYPLLMGRNK